MRTLLICLGCHTLQHRSRLGTAVKQILGQTTMKKIAESCPPRNAPNNYFQHKSLHHSSHVADQWCQDDPYGNPMKELEPLMKVPITKPGDTVFDPSKEDIIRAQDAFKPPKGRTIEPLKGIVNLEHLPTHDLPEVPWKCYFVLCSFRPSYTQIKLLSLYINFEIEKYGFQL